MNQLDKIVNKQYTRLWSMLGLVRSVSRIGYVNRHMKTEKKLMDLCGKALYESVEGNNELIDLMEISIDSKNRVFNNVGNLMMQITAISNGLNKFSNDRNPNN